MKTRHRTVWIEACEPRTLLAASVSFAGGLLTIHGTDAANTIVLTRRGQNVQVKLDRRAHVFRDVRSVAIDGHGGDDVIVVGGKCGQATLRGGDGNDTLRVARGANVLEGGAGDDHLVGGDGIDILDGGAGDDVLDGGLGGDLLIGGDGNDTADYSSRTAPLRLSHGLPRGETGENDSINPDIETLIGGEGDDSLSIHDDDPTRSFVIDARGGDDEIHAYIEGKLTVFCGAGDDFLDLPFAAELVAYGGPGNDHLDGSGAYSSSHDPSTLLGGPGDDLIHPIWLDVTVADGGTGNDHLDLSQVTFDNPLVLDLRSDPFTRFERITGSYGDDLIIAGDDPMLIRGGDYEEAGDTLIGGAGNDTLIGSGGDDLLIGNGGDDLMLGGDGDDVIVNSGNGADTIDGGEGNDTADDDPLDTLLQVEVIL